MGIWNNSLLFKPPPPSTEGAFFVYNIAERETFSQIEKYLKIVQIFSINILIGYKYDEYKKRERKVSYEEGKNLANKYGIAFYEANFETGENVQTIFNYFAMEIIKKIKGGLKLKKRSDIKDKDIDNFLFGSEEY